MAGFFDFGDATFAFDFGAAFGGAFFVFALDFTGAFVTAFGGSFAGAFGAALTAFFGAGFFFGRAGSAAAPARPPGPAGAIWS